MRKLIVFDLSGVVFTNGKPIAARKLAETSGLDESIVLKLLGDNTATDYYLGKITPEEFWQHLQAELKVESGGLKTLWLESYQPIESSFEFIKELRQQGYKTACLSESPKDRVEYQQDKFGLLELFDFSVFSYETKTPKPSQELFELLIEKSGIAPQHSAYLDDKRDNLLIPERMGYKTVLIENPQALTKLKF